MNKAYKHFLSFVICMPVLSLAEQNIVIEKDVIKGNTELPKVMYIIPWRETTDHIKAPEIKLRNYYDDLLMPLHLYDIKEE